MKKAMILFSMCCALVSASIAQTVSVPGDHATITAALAAVKANVATPDVVNITTVGPYNESFLIDFSVTVQGFGATPIIIAPGTTGSPAASLDGRGIAFTTTAGDITATLKNLILIPSTATPPSRGIYSNNNTAGVSADQMDLFFEDIVVTSNDGSGNPIDITGLANASLGGGATWGDDITFFAGFADVTMTNVVLAYGLGAASPDAIVFNPDVAGHTLSVGAGSVLSNTNRIGIQVAGDGSIVNLIGTSSDPIIIQNTGLVNNLNGAIAMFQDNNSVSGATFTLSHVILCDNKHAGITCSFVDDPDSVSQLTADYLTIINNEGAAISINDNISTTWNITNSTIANNGTRAATDMPALNATAGAVASAGTINFTDCIVAGNGEASSANGNNAINVAVAGVQFAFNYSGLVTAGPYLLSSTAVLSNGGVAPTTNEVVSNDPDFVSLACNTSDTGDVNSPYYFAQGTGNSNLSGSGDWVGTIPSSADTVWAIYE